MADPTTNHLLLRQGFRGRGAPQGKMPTSTAEHSQGPKSTDRLLGLSGNSLAIPTPRAEGGSPSGERPANPHTDLVVLLARSLPF